MGFTEDKNVCKYYTPKKNEKQVISNQEKTKKKTTKNERAWFHGLVEIRW